MADQPADQPEIVPADETVEPGTGKVRHDSIKDIDQDQRKNEHRDPNAPQPQTKVGTA